MAKLINIQIDKLPDMRIIGKLIRPKLDMEENPIPEFWQKCFNDGTFETLEKLEEHSIDTSYVGWMSDWSNIDGKFTYICGILMEAGTPVPDGFTYRDIPGSTVAIGWIQGPEKETYPVAHGLTEEAMKEQGYEIDEDDPWCMELYNCPRFTSPKENGDIVLDYYIACRKK